MEKKIDPTKPVYLIKDRDGNWHGDFGDAPFLTKRWANVIRHAHWGRGEATVVPFRLVEIKKKPNKKINPNKIPTRDRLLERLINGATKSGVHVDRRKRANKRACRVPTKDTTNGT